MKNYFIFHFNATAKNQGIAITKNTASTTLHTDHHQPYASSHSPQSSTHVSVESTSINGFPTSRSDLDIAMLQILDPHLRPIPPANDPTSQKIYKEHMDLAQEYFKVRRCFSYFKREGGLNKFIEDQKMLIFANNYQNNHF